MGLSNAKTEIILGLETPLCSFFSNHSSPRREFLKGNFLTKEAGSGQYYTCSEYSEYSLIY